MTIIDELLKKGIITPALSSEILEKVGDNPEISLDDMLIEAGVDPIKLVDARSKVFDMPVMTIDPKTISHDLMKYIPQESVKRFRFVPLSIDDNVLSVGIVDPEFIAARDAVSFIAGKVGLPYKLFLISKPDFDSVLETYKSLNTQVTNAIDQLGTEIEEVKDKKADISPEYETQDLNRIVENLGITMGSSIVEDAPITKIVAAILKNAIEADASDIHIEPIGEKVQVRFRVDGILKVSLELPQAAQSAVIARVKILSNLRLDEKRKPQDGRFSSLLDGRKIDFRVSTLPCYYGEKAEIRILDSFRGVRDLDALGYTQDNLKLVKKAITMPYGIVLISGPTGSGKTTTLYSMLQQIDRSKANVVSLEDPVEYNIPGMNQSQIMPEIGYTFATGLRSILRQDPDVILVGEIRDKETAQLAIQAALTGHLVFSTIHTNTAIGVVPRLIDMEVDPYLIAPTLICSIGQRLVQTIAPGCAKEMPVSESIQKMLEKQFADVPENIREKLPFKDTVYESEPNEQNPTGLKGRIAVQEVLWVTKEIETMILTKATEPDLYKVARQQGFISLKEDAIFKSMEGKIPYHEVYNL